MGEATCPKCGEVFEATASRFKPPTVEEVEAYAREKGYTFSPIAFVAHYEARGWKFKAGSPVKSWRACCVTWQEREDERHPNNPHAVGKREKALVRHLSAAGYEIPEPEWVKDLRHRIHAREAWSKEELEAMKLWEAGKPVTPPRKPTSWEEVEK